MIQIWDLLKTRESHFFCLVNGLFHLPMQAHNQKFFKAAEVSWHVDKHVVKKHTKKRPCKGRFSNFFSPIVKTAFSKSGHFFSILNSSPFLCAPYLVSPAMLRWSQSFYCWLWPGKLCRRSTFALFLSELSYTFFIKILLLVRIYLFKHFICRRVNAS